MADLEHGLTIHELDPVETVSGDAYVAIDDGTNTKKAKIADLNSASASSAQTYAQNAADSATSAASSATQAQTAAQSIQGSIVQATSQLQGYVDDAAASAASAATSETNIRNMVTSDYAKLARSYATGDSGSREGEETDNAKYYSENAADSAINAATSATDANTENLKAEGHAVGQQNGVDVDSSSPYYHNNAKYYSEIAQGAGAGGVNSSVIAPAEVTSTATRAYSVGDQFVYNGVLYKATSPISIGSTIVPGTNCTIADNLVYQIGEKQNIVLASTMTIGGQTITEVEPALRALNEKSGGSKITISTNETTLHGKTVTVTGTSETKTATIGNDGKAVIDGFMDTGSVTISASDGTDTATVTISIPYFGNYAVTLSFWAAALSITTDSPDLYGQTITVKDSNNQTVATSVFSGQGTATATVNSTGTYTVSATGDGVTVNESVTVSAQTTYNVSLHLWTATVSISTSSSELYSATITVKKGGSTVGTTTFSAQGSATYKAHETDTYTFECTYGGQTYSDSVTVSAETSYSATIDTAPDGSTVTPTDDIQTWLKCANINESYTTLSQVLNDHETLYALINNNNAMDYLVRSKSWATFRGAIPVMTSDTTPSGVASSSSNQSGKAAWMAFKNETTTNPNDNTWTSNEVNPAWVQYQFDTPIVAKKAKVMLQYTPNPDAYLLGKRFVISASNNGTDFTELYSSGNTDLPNQPYSAIVDLNNNTAYSYYRITVTGSYYSAYVGVCIFQVYEYENPVSEGITDNATAMNYIGHKNYASDVLLDDSTWCAAICDSTYMEDVLNTKVPTMTSNTTPSGEAFGNPAAYNSDLDYWKCFGGGETCYINGATQGYYAYDFNKLVGVKYVSCYNNNSASRTANVIYSDDRTNWVNCSEVITQQSKAQSSIYVNNNTGKHRYWGILIFNNDNGNTKELQFYGRSDVTENVIDIYSAASDTVYYMDNGSPVTVCTTDTTGHGTVSKSSLPAGTYTLYSTVAKDPENLSNDYSKSVTVASNTVEIKVMPDNVLYWWGYENGTEWVTEANGWSKLSGVYTNVEGTHNTNNIYLQASSGQCCTYSSSQKINMNKIHGIAQAITITTEFGVAMLRYIDKNWTTPSNAPITYWAQVGTIQHFINNFETEPCYIAMHSSDGRAGYVYALWYE